MRKSLVLAVLAYSPATQAGELQNLFGCKAGKVCTIKKNLGGDVGEFISAANEAIASKTKVRIAGLCASACAIFADVLRDSNNVCLTRNAVFGFHKATVSEKLSVSAAEVLVPIARFDQPQSPEVDVWVRQHGDFPEVGFTAMYYRDALQFWKACS